MKLVPLAFASLALAGGIVDWQRPPERVVILSGDTLGYLAPCGCTSPMIGGIKRRARAIRSLSLPGRTTVLDNGNLVAGLGRQDQMKAETMAQALATMGVAAINLGPSDAGLGPGELMQIAQLSGNRIITLSLSHPERRLIGGATTCGPFLVGGIMDAPDRPAALLGDTAVSIDDSVAKLVDEARSSGLAPILMLQGGRDTAIAIARRFPRLALIQYSSRGTPPDALEMIGDVPLATSGEHGKYLVRVVYRNGGFTEYRRIALGPEFADDPEVSRFYSTYLRRVRDENLLGKLPRHDTEKYAGSWACGSCHAAATHVWKASQHRKAYQTLVRQGHDADPDCVGCHVVGLESSSGFHSAKSTPQFAGVGCENCHGPARRHAIDPKSERLTVSPKSCVGCHNPENSPNFQFDAYWRKITHR